MCQSIRQRNQEAGGSSKRTRKNAICFARIMRRESLSLTLLYRYYTDVWERDGQLLVPSGTVLQPGASQPEVVTLSVSVHQLVPRFAAAAEAALQPRASQPQVLPHPLSVQQLAPWIAQQPASSSASRQCFSAGC